MDHPIIPIPIRPRQEIDSRSTGSNPQNDEPPPAKGFDNPEPLPSISQLLLSRIEDASVQSEISSLNLWTNKQSHSAAKIQVCQVKKQQIKQKQIRRCRICSLGMNNKKGFKIRKCQECKLWIHLQCELGTVQDKKKYVCYSCSLKQDKNSKSNKQGANQTPVEKKKSQKRKTRQKKEHLILLKPQSPLPPPQMTEKQKSFIDFQFKYPLYVSQSQQIQFPISDEVFQNYRQLFLFEHHLPTDIFIKTEIPEDCLGDILFIQNFFYSSQSSIKLAYNLSKQYIYQCLNLHHTNRYYNTLINNILMIFLNDFMNNKKTQNTKFLNQNTFFGFIRFLQGKTDMKIFVSIMRFQLIELICQSPQYQQKLKQLTQILKLNQFQHKYDQQYSNQTKKRTVNLKTYKQKCKTLIDLIECLNDNQSYRNIILRNQVSKQGDKTDQELLSQIEQFTISIKDFDEMIQHNQSQIELVSNKILRGLRADEIQKMERTKGQLMMMAKEMEEQKQRLRNNISDNEAKIFQIKRSNVFPLSSLLLLGLDRNNSQYYMHYKEPNRIYVNYKSSRLEQTTVFKVIQGTHNLNKLKQCLNLKGVKEKGLHEQITKYLNKGFICDTPQNKGIQFAHEMAMDLCSVTIRVVQDILLSAESRMTEYSKSIQMEWGTQKERQQYRYSIEKIEKKNLNFLKQSVCYLHQRSKSLFYIADKNENQRMINKKRVIIWPRYQKSIKQRWQSYMEKAQSVEQIWFCAKILEVVINDYVLRRTGKVVQNQNTVNQNSKPLKIFEQLSLNKEIKQELEHFDSSSEYQTSNKRKSTHKSAVKKANDKKKSTRSTRRKKRGKQSSSDDDNYEPQSQSNCKRQYARDQNTNKCDSCRKEGNLLKCATCPLKLHLECLNLKEPPKGKWMCSACKSKCYMHST